MVVWKFNGQDLREKMGNEKATKELALAIKTYGHDDKMLTEIIEKAYCLESGQITKREIEILQEQLKEKGIDRFIKQFKQFGNFGYTPYILG